MSSQLYTSIWYFHVVKLKTPHIKLAHKSRLPYDISFLYVSTLGQGDLITGTLFKSSLFISATMNNLSNTQPYQITL